jgi:hypothetical protein
MTRWRSIDHQAHNKRHADRYRADRYREASCLRAFVVNRYADSLCITVSGMSKLA